jgi:dynein heavy chain 2, cytosolic
VPSRALISSAYLTYLSSANETMRDQQLREWLSGFKSPDYNFRNFLSSESEMLTWKKEGLPADNLSMENAIMIMNSTRTCLVIDPSTQASEWLKTSIKKQSDNVEILNHQDPKFNTNLELSIRFGKVLIIQEVDGIESLLVPILRKELIQQGPRQVVQIGEKSVDYNPAFRLYLTTRD